MRADPALSTAAWPTSTRTRGLALVGCWSVALAVPSASFVLFDGLPFSSVAELCVLGIGVVVVCSSRCRRVVSRALSGLEGRRFIAVLGAAVLVITLKLVTLVAAPTVGFEACYTTPVAPRPGGGCELSYENLTSRGDVTRVDETIDFGPRVPAEGDARLISGSDWDLSFVNDWRVGALPPEEGELVVERLPFTARWRGEIQVRRRGQVPVTYVGEGSARIGGETVRLAPSYGRERTVFVPVGTGRPALSISYAFADRYHLGDGEPRGPYATIRVGAVQHDGHTQSSRALHAAPPASGWTLVAIGIDVTFVLLGLALVASVVAAATRSRALIAAGALAGLGAWALTSAQGSLGPLSVPVQATVLVYLVLVLVLLYRRVEDLLLLGAPAAVLLAAERVLAPVVPGTWSLPDLHSVLFRTRGDDWLSYQSFARSILEHGSLQGGENVFYFQPGFRYWAFASHVVSGDGDAIPAIAGVALMLIAVLVATRGSVGRARTGRALPRGDALLVVAVALGALVVLATAPPVVGIVQVGLSEYPTWIIIPVLPILLFTRPSWPRWVAGSALLATTVLIRPNQGIPALFLFAVFAAWQVRRAPRRVLTCGAVVVVLLLLPAAHNLWYGGELALLPTGAGTVYDLPVERLLDVFTDASVRVLLRDKLLALAYLLGRLTRDPTLGISILTLQLAWLTTLVRAVRRRSVVPWHAWGVLLWPVAFAVPSVFYDVYIYYPRHIVAMYVAAGTAVIFVEARYLSTARQAAVTGEPPAGTSSALRSGVEQAR